MGHTETKSSRANAVVECKAQLFGAAAQHAQGSLELKPKLRKARPKRKQALLSQRQLSQAQAAWTESQLIQSSRASTVAIQAVVRVRLQLSQCISSRRPPVRGAPPQPATPLATRAPRWRPSHRPRGAPCPAPPPSAPSHSRAAPRPPVAAPTRRTARAQRRAQRRASHRPRGRCACARPGRSTPAL